MDRSFFVFMCRILQIIGDAIPMTWLGPSYLGANFAANPSAAFDKWCSLAHTTAPNVGVHCLLLRL